MILNVFECCHLCIQGFCIDAYICNEISASLALNFIDKAINMFHIRYSNLLYSVHDIPNSHFAFKLLDMYEYTRVQNMFVLKYENFQDFSFETLPLAY